MAVYPRSVTPGADTNADTDAGTGAGTGVPAQPDFPALERDVLAYWQAQDTFRTSVQQRPADDEFVF
jgi:isoleucyl-tRNA synthetase